MKKQIFAIILVLLLLALVGCGGGSSGGQGSSGAEAENQSENSGEVELPSNRYKEIAMSYQGDTYDEVGDSLVIYEDGRGVLKSLYNIDEAQDVVFDPSENMLYAMDGSTSYHVELEDDYITVYLGDDGVEMFELEGEESFSLKDLTVDVQALLTERSDQDYAESTPETSEDGWTHISTPEEFLQIADDLNGKYVLDEDIDDWWGGESTVFSPIGTPDNPFKGELNGNGHVVTGTMAYTGQEESWALFGCNEGYIHDLTIGYIHAPEMQARWDDTFEEEYTLEYLESADVPMDATKYYGVLSGINRGTIENITFEEYADMPNIYCYPNENEKIYVGYVAAYNDGTVRGVSFSSTGLEMRTMDQYAAVDVGVVCGYQTSGAVMEDVVLKLDNSLWLAGWGMSQFISPTLNAGLLIGEAEDNVTVINSTALEGGQVDGSSVLAGADVKLGGLIGYVQGDIELTGIEASELQVFHDGQNADSMDGQDYTPAPGAVHSSGGLVGWADGNVTFSDIDLNNVSARTVLRPGGDPQPSCVGGFVGYCGGNLVADSVTFGGEYAGSDGSVEQGIAYAGGIAGYCGGTAEVSDSSIAVSMNPIFHGSVIYQSNIIGYLVGEGTFTSLNVTCELDDQGESVGHSLVADPTSTYYVASIAGYAESSVSVTGSFIDVVYNFLGTPGAAYYDESVQGMYNGG